ncbi:hypothetical protein [Enterovibrio paralichthyis]|nr:hypothetical protein [Enterovibrio paralichthyis]MBV7298935.1 hypothetical protein [Enterovibrio paralichthyis]
MYPAFLFLGCSHNSGQSVGAINMGSPTGVNPWLIGGVVIVLAFLVLRKK